MKWEDLSDADLLKYCESLPDKKLKKLADDHARVYNVCNEEYTNRHLDTKSKKDGAVSKYTKSQK